MTNWLLPAKHNWTADSFADKAMPSSAEVNALMDELLNPNCPDMNQDYCFGGIGYNSKASSNTDPNGSLLNSPGVPTCGAVTSDLRGAASKFITLGAESAHPTPLLDPASAGASILSPEAAPAAGDFADLGDLEDITGGEYRRQLLLDQLEADYDELAADAGRGWDVSHDAMIGNLLASPAGDARPRPLPPLTPERAERVGQSVPVEGPRDGPATGAPVRAHGGEGARVRLDFGADLDFEWIEPDGKKDRPLQGAAKSNATILLTGSRHSISVNSLLQEDNHIFEDLLPPLVRAKGLVLGHPQRILVRAVLLALLRGIPDSELVDKYALHVVPRLRAGLPLDKAMTEALFPRRKKGTTKYEMAEGLAAVFEDYGLPWPGKCISDADAIYLRDKYDSKKGTHLHARSYIHAQGGV